jgi:hypothetical protein
MFWFLYLLSVLIFCYFLSTFISKRFKNILILVTLIFLLTPAQVDIGLDNYSPALFAFIFNYTLEQSNSFRVLRPLFLSLTSTLLIYYLITLIRKKFF